MIRDLDASLCSWLSEMMAGEAVPGADPVPVTVGLPEPKQARSAKPALFLYLASVRQDAEGSLADWSSVRAEDGLTVGRRPPLRRYRLAYLVIPQAPDAATEHALLGTVLAGGALSNVLPPEHLSGSLANAHGSVLVTAAPEEPQADASELWLAWGLSPRACLELNVLAPLPLAYVTEVAAPPSEVVLGASRRSPAAENGEAQLPLRPPPRGRISEGPAGGIRG